MSLSNVIASWFLSMFLIAPMARGESTDGLSTFVLQVHSACREAISNKIAVWKGITSANRQSLATALCNDDRVMWPFAEGLYGETALKYEEHFRNRSNFSALVIGFIGGSPREVSEAMHAIRSILYPLSNSVFTWTNGPRQLREWMSDFNGGQFGGVVQLAIDGKTEFQMNQDIQSAVHAIDFTMAHEMNNYTLVIHSARDLRAEFSERTEPINWVQFESVGCDRLLRF